MESHPFLQTVLVFLLAAVIAVPLTKRFRLGAVFGYLLAGVAIGPHALALVADPAGVATLSELGVVLLLFVIGLELSPRRLWVMRQAVFGAGLAQVLGCGLAIGLLAHFAFGLHDRAALIVGGSLALSSTAFGLQILAERREVGTPYGRLAFAILLFQDLAAIPLLALVPLLAGEPGHGIDATAALRTLAAILAVVVGGRYLLRPVFRFVARADAVEVSTATALLVVMGTAWLMERVGVSATLGAFLAGVLLADSEYRHELESHLEPFKGLLLGLFFVSVGMSMDPGLLREQPGVVAALVLGLLVLKGVLLWPVGRWLGDLAPADALRLAALLAGGGEFAFVVLKPAAGQGLLDAALHDRLVLAITLSMALTPLLVTALGRALGARERPPPRPFDDITTDSPRVIIAGYGRVGQIVARVLRAQNIRFVALDHSVEQLDLVQRFGNVTDIYYGDPARPELLRAAHAAQAEVLVLASDDPDSSLRVARVVRRQFPHLKIVARARNRQHVWRLMDLGVDEPVRETLYSSLEMTRMTLQALGLSDDVAAARVERFRDQDTELLKRQYLVYDDEARIVQTSREALVDLERLFQADEEQGRRPPGPPAAGD